MPNRHETAAGRAGNARLAAWEESLIGSAEVPPRFRYYVLGKKA